MIPMLVPRKFEMESPASFMVHFRQAAIEESTLLEWRSIVSSLIEDPPAYETVSKAQAAIELELIHGASLTIDRVQANALNCINSAALLTITPELCSQLIVHEDGHPETIPLTVAECNAFAEALVSQGVAYLHSAEALMAAITMNPGYYRALVPTQQAAHLSALQSDRSALLQVFGKHANPTGIDNDRLQMQMDLYKFYGELTEIGSRVTEIHFTMAAYCDTLTAQIYSGTLATAYNCLQPQGPFMKTYLKEHPAITKILQASGVLLPEGMTPC